MDEFAPEQLSRRERQIMEIVYARKRVTAAEVQEGLGGDAPGYSAVRSALALLEKKGWVTHSRDGLKYVFEPRISGDNARRSVLRRITETFFRNSALEVVQTLLADRDLKLDEDEIVELEALIKKARKRRRS